MKSPIPLNLLDMALRFGAKLEITDDFRLTLKTSPLPPKLAQEIADTVDKNLREMGFMDEDANAGRTLQ